MLAWFPLNPNNITTGPDGPHLLLDMALHVFHCTLSLFCVFASTPMISPNGLSLSPSLVTHPSISRLSIACRCHSLCQCFFIFYSQSQYK